MRIAIVGYGRMGRVIESVATARAHEVVARIDVGDEISSQTLHDAEVAIEFTGPDSAVANVEKLAACGTNVVVGSTGWLEHLDQVKETVVSAGIGLVWSPNFSIGVNAFLRIVAEAARVLKDQPEYEAWAYEIHHSKKLDAPSGTLLKVVEAMRAAGYSSTVDIASNRAGAISGTHVIGFDSLADTIELTHRAKGREGFALGAVKAAEWVRGRTGMVEFSDIVLEID